MNDTLQRRGAIAAAAALLIVALLPYVVAFLPRIYFDVDPNSEAAAQSAIAFGPAFAGWYCVIAVLLACLIMGWCVLLRRAVAWWAVALVSVGIVAQMVHFRGPDDLWYGSAWIAGACLALAAYHLCQLPGAGAGARRWIIAGFVAVLLPLTIDAVWFVTVEHAETIESYQRQQQQWIDARGGETVTNSQQLYERRLHAPDFIGNFSLSNVLGSLTMASVLLGTGLLLASPWRWGRPAALLVSVGGAVTLYLTHSRGAQAAMFAGLIVLLAACWLTGVPHPRAGVSDAAHGRTRPWHPTMSIRVRRWLLMAMSMGVPVAAVAVVLAVGAMGPSPEGAPISSAKLTLLFRYHYWQGASRIAADHPLIGVGQAGFREQYLSAKNPLSPEDVRSAHNLFVDWISMLGLGGWAWTALIVTWLLRATKMPATEDDHPPPVGYERWLPCAAVAAVLFGIQYVIKLDSLWWGTALLWLAEALGFLLLMGLLVAGRINRRWMQAGMLAAAVGLIGHNQIEMTFHHMPSVVPAWMLLALAAAGAPSAAKAKRFDWVIVPLLLIAAVMLVVCVAGPVTRQQEHLAAALRAIQSGRGQAALAELDASALSVAGDDTTLRWRILLRLEKAQALAKFGDARGAERVRRETLALCEPAAFGGVDSFRLDRWRSNVHEALGDLDAAIADQKRVIERLPYSLPDYMRYADLLAEVGRRAEAVEAYRDVLALSAQRYLDPAVQLNDEQRQRLVAYIEQAVGSRQ
ncbi:MAG: O-antigen ligase family protein [Phycisphaeraceae bacterium]|nr:O-antigen ligase family protein [Phycisphaeraceae bacterium]